MSRRRRRRSIKRIRILWTIRGHRNGVATTSTAEKKETTKSSPMEIAEEICVASGPDGQGEASLHDVPLRSSNLRDTRRSFKHANWIVLSISSFTATFSNDALIFFFYFLQKKLLFLTLLTLMTVSLFPRSTEGLLGLGECVYMCPKIVVKDPSARMQFICEVSTRSKKGIFCRHICVMYRA